MESERGDWFAGKLVVVSYFKPPPICVILDHSEKRMLVQPHAGDSPGTSPGQS